MDKKPSKTPTSTRGCTFLQSKSSSAVVENGDSFYCLNQSVPRPIAPPRPRTPYPRSTPGPSNSGHSQAGPSHAGPSHAGPSQTGPSRAGPSQAGPSHAGPSNPGPSTASPSNPSPLPARRSSTVWGKTFLASHSPDDDSSSDHSSTLRPKTLVRSRHGYLQGFPFPDPPLPEQDVDNPAVSPTPYASKTAPGPSRLREQVVLSPPVAAGGQGSSSASEISELSLGPPAFEGGGSQVLGLLSSLRERVEEPVVEEPVVEEPVVQKKPSPGGKPPPVSLFENVDLTGAEGAEGGEYLTGMKLGCLIVALMASVFLVSLDRTIISTVSLPPSPGCRSG